MEKFLETPSPDPKMIYETSIFPLPVKPAPDDSSEAGIKILEISSIKKSIEDIEVKTRLSDSHSIGTSSTSDNNSSFRGDGDEHVELQAHFSDSQSTGNSFTSDVNSSSMKEIEGMPSNQLPEIVEFQNADNRKPVIRDDAHVHEEGISDSRQTNSESLTSEKMLCSYLEPTKPVET